MESKIQTAASIEKSPEADLMSHFKEQFQDAVEANAEWFERCKESFRFYTGLQQWDPEVVAILMETSRPALTINHCFPIVNMLTGFQRQNRSDVKLYPRRGGTKPIADVGTELLKHTMDISEGIYESSDMFQDGCIGGKGWLSVDTDYKYDPINGDLDVIKESPFSIIEDQNNRHYDLNRGNYVFKTFWWDKRAIQLNYPKKAKELLESMNNQSDYANTQFFDTVGDDYGNVHSMQGFNDDDESRMKTQYYVKERWYKRWEKSVCVVHVPTLTVSHLDRNQHKMVQEKISALGITDYKIVERPREVMYKTTAIGEMILEHIREPLGGVSLFPFFRFCPYWIDGYVMGVVDNIKGPQQEMNKNRSQTLHSMNATVNSGFIVGNVNNQTALDELERFGTRPGKVFNKKDFGGEIEKIKPSPLDSGHFALGQQGGADMKDISGVNADLIGTNPKSSESGRARLIRQQSGLTVVESVFDNAQRTEKQLGTFLWEVIRRGNVYSEEEVIAVVQESSIQGFTTVNPLTQEETIDLSPLKDWNTGLYGVKVEKGANLPTVRMANFEQMLEIAKLGLPIPPELLVELSDVPNRDEIVAFLRQVRMQAQNQPGAPAAARQPNAGKSSPPSKQIVSGERAF